MSLEISNEALDHILKKYEKLMIKITYNITGDNAVGSSFDDNMQELRIKSIEALHAFSRQTGEKNLDFLVKTRGFDKYLKTCMWNLKNSTGTKIVKNTKVLGEYRLSYNDHNLDVEDTSVCLDFPVFNEDLKLNLSPTHCTALSFIIEDPSVLKSNGRLNVAKLARKMDLPWYDVKKVVDRISSLIDKEAVTS